MENQIVVSGWDTIVPHHLRYTPTAGEPVPKPYRPRYPYAVIFFKKVKKMYHHEQICSGIRVRNLRSVDTGGRYSLSGVEHKLEYKDEVSAPRYKRIVRADAVIEW